MPFPPPPKLELSKLVKAATSQMRKPHSLGEEKIVQHKIRGKGKPQKASTFIEVIHTQKWWSRAIMLCRCLVNQVTFKGILKVSPTQEILV